MTTPTTTTGQPPDAEAAPAGDRATAPARRRGRNLLVELLVIVAGVLIALALEGLWGWIADRALAREAHETIRREIADNLADVEDVLAANASRDAALGNAVRFVDELLERGTTEVTSLELGFEMAELSSASWETAERTGALAEMEYADVREYAQVYEAQARYQEQQRRTLERLAAASAVLHAADDPLKASPEDLRAFRAHVLELRAALDIQQQLLERTRYLYRSVLGLDEAGGEEEAQ
jgi:hypothetical protein